MNPENNNLNEMRIVACERLISNIESFQEEAPRDINLLLALDRAKFAASYFNRNRLPEGRVYIEFDDPTYYTDLQPYPLNILPDKKRR